MKAEFVCHVALRQKRVARSEDSASDRFFDLIRNGDHYAAAKSREIGTPGVCTTLSHTHAEELADWERLYQHFFCGDYFCAAPKSG
ncbi:hypothetical protein PWP93_36660 [Paraburkholderia sp. A1RI-2L]|uniref:hypothetical protein n=1 Tax=Paraburkholderia sp. A1RI-2L TaxID=3028367 RepID=UPI003B79952B